MRPRRSRPRPPTSATVGYVMHKDHTAATLTFFDDCYRPVADIRLPWCQIVRLAGIITALDEDR